MTETSAAELPSPQRGLTLFETLVAIAILVAMAAIVAPSMIDTLDRHRLTSAVDVIVEQALLARAHAAANGEAVELVATGDAVEVRRFQNDPGEPADLLSEQWARRTVPTGVVLEANGAAVGEQPEAETRIALFLPDGSSLATEPLVVRGGDESRQIDISGWTGLPSVGEAEVESGAGDDPPPAPES